MPERSATRPAAAPAAALSALSDEAVVGRVLGGEPELFEILMRRHNQRLFRIARGVVRDDDEAEDVMQEAYVRAYRELAGFRGEARFSTWLARIAVHEALSRVRKLHRLVPLAATGEERGGHEPADPAPGADSHRAAESRELGAALQEAVESLPEPLRLVFLLRDVEGLSTEETAAAAGISPENVKVRLHRARAALRRRLDARIGREVRRLYLFHEERCDRLTAAVFARLGVG